MREIFDSMRKRSIEATSREVLLLLRRTATAADLASMIGLVCSSVDSVVAASCGVVLIKLEHCMPESVVWPRLITGCDAEFVLYFQSVSPVLPFDCDRCPRPVTWTRPQTISPRETVPAWSASGSSAAIGLTDRSNGTCYLLALHRDGRSAPFSVRDGTLLQVISVFVSRMLTLRSLADQREQERLHYKETEQAGTVPGELLYRRGASRERLTHELAGEPR